MEILAFAMLAAIVVVFALAIGESVRLYRSLAPIKLRDAVLAIAVACLLFLFGALLLNN